MSYLKTKTSGFSLIELIIVIAIIAIMATVGIPSYTEYMLKSRRVDAISFLTEVAGEQTKFYSENNQYTNSMADLGYGTEATAPSNEGYYSVSIATADSNATYVLTAAPVAGGPQEKDTECGSLSLNSSSVKGETGTGTVDSCW